jgi:hypothetical protein
MRAVWVVLAGCGRIGFDPGVEAGSDASTAASCGAETSLVACFAFEGDTLDSSGLANHATGAVTFAAGRIGMAALFDETTTVLAPDTPSLDVSSAATAMMWVRIDAPPTGNRGVGYDRNNGLSIAILNDRTPVFSVATSATTHNVMTQALELGVWIHLAATFDGSEIALYRDGVEAARAITSGPALDTADPDGSRIGGNLAETTNPGNEPWPGAIDELGIWSEALPAARIACAAADNCSTSGP